MGREFATLDRRSYFDAVDAERRQLRLEFTSDGLLRKPETAVQTRRMRALANTLTRQAHEQIRAQGRRPFRGEVAVELDIHAVGVEQPVTSPPAVKAYLDLLQGIVYTDDRSIAYLRVTRHARDNPLFQAVPQDWVYGGVTPRFPHGPEAHVEVRITVQPLRTYVADVDRMFHLREEVFGDDYDDRDADGGEFFRDRFGHNGFDDNRLDELREEARDETEGRGLWASGGPLAARPDLLASLRQMHRAERRALRRKLLLDGGPGPLDRPGPPSVIQRLMWHQDPDSKRLDADDWFGPGRFLLPDPSAPRGLPWPQEVKKHMAAHHGRWRVLDVLVGAPLALDLAVRPEASKDLDNLARDIVVPFEQVFCGNDRGTVASYRIYRAEPDSGPPGVRVLVIGDERLNTFERAIATARHWLLLRGPRYKDD